MPKRKTDARKGGHRQERAGGYSPATRGEEGELRIPSHSGIRARRKLEHIADQHRRGFVEHERLLAHDDAEQMLQARNIPAQMLQQVPTQMWQGVSPSPGADVAAVSPSPGADVAAVSPSRGADVAAATFFFVSSGVGTTPTLFRLVSPTARDRARPP